MAAIVNAVLPTIKSIQSVSATDNTAGTTLDVTIAAVTIAKAFIVPYGVSSSETSLNNLNYTAEFLSETQVRLTRAGTATTFRVFRFQVVEFN